MTGRNRIFEDAARVAGGAFDSLTGIRREAEALVRHHIDRILSGMDLVTRDEFNAVKEMATEARIGRVFVDDCIQRLNDGTLDTETASMAKWWCTEKQFETANQALQLHGGYGYMMDYPVAHYFADSRVQMIYGGTNEIMKEVISRSL